MNTGRGAVTARTTDLAPGRRQVAGTGGCGWPGRAGLGLLATLVVAAAARPAGAAAAERFEIAELKAARVSVTEIVAAVESGDGAAARAALARYDSQWNGVEIYIGARSRDSEEAVEHRQEKLAGDLDAPAHDGAATADARALLTAYDEAIEVVAKAPPLDPLYGDVARLRVVRADLRAVVPALKAGDSDKARKAFAAFRDAWGSVEGIVKARSAADAGAIADEVVEIGKLLEERDSGAAVTRVQDVLTRYNATHAALLKAARGK